MVTVYGSCAEPVAIRFPAAACFIGFNETGKLKK